MNLTKPDRLFLMTTLFLAFAAAGCTHDGNGGDAAAEVSTVLEIDRVVPVGRAEITESLELVGTLVPWRFAAIVPEVDGVIEHLPAYEKEIEYEVGGEKYTQPVTLDIGHAVKENDILVELDPRQFELALNVAQRKLDLAKAEFDKLVAWRRSEEVDQLRAQRDEAAAVFEQAKLDLKRCEELCARDVASKSDHDAAVMTYNTAEAAKKRAEAALKLAEGAPTPEEVAVAKAQVELAQAEVALCQEDLDKCTIKSPFDGVITDRYKGVGDRVTAGPRVEIMQIIDPSILFAQVAVPERYQHAIRVNDTAVVQAPGVSEPVPGVVGLVNEKIDPQTRTFRVRVGVENKKRDPDSDSTERIFKSGSYVRVTLPVKSSPGALVVPTEAITFDEGLPAVFVFRGDHVEKRPVKLGISNRAEYEVVEGLSEGERIVAAGTALLADGIPVRLRAPGSSPPEVARADVPASPKEVEAHEGGLSLASEPRGGKR
jgi:multidrug efflux pump subunit AcrA (membrane-fusion protein)